VQSKNQAEVQLVAFGEFMLRLHSAETKRFLQAGGYNAYYAGAEANVCVLLSRLGIKTSYVTHIPENDIALAGVEQLRSQGVGTEDILYGGDRLGVYFTEQGNAIRATRVIYDRAGSAYAQLQPGMIDWAAIFNGVKYFHWSGIAAAVSSGAAAVCAEALSAAHDKGVIISADFNYRTMLWKYGKHPSEVMPAFLQYSEIAVADLDSANIYYGITTDKNASFEERFKQCSQALLEKLPHLKALAMSFRKTRGSQYTYAGALMYHGAYYFSTGHELALITDQIGSGDAFTGGLLYSIINAFDPQKIIDFATACGALKHSIVGDWAIINRAEAEQFIHTGSSGRIIR
jgi:2-dehydro-3-deoxygluconokinase